MIENDLLCPICNHQSVVALDTTEEVNEFNKNVMDIYSSKIDEWIASGKLGEKPRMGMTKSQSLGCVCLMQNCIGNTNGSGCFRCKGRKQEYV